MDMLDILDNWSFLLVKLITRNAKTFLPDFSLYDGLYSTSLDASCEDYGSFASPDVD
jgi:hypothetical protein